METLMPKSKFLLALLLGFLFLTTIECSRSDTASDDRMQSARQAQAYLGTWRSMGTSGGTIKISDNGNNLVVKDDRGQTLLATVNRNGDLETAFGTMSIEKGHLLGLSGEYERVDKLSASGTHE
jgi:hypothetical protein